MVSRKLFFDMKKPKKKADPMTRNVKRQVEDKERLEKKRQRVMRKQKLYMAVPHLFQSQHITHSL